MTDFKDDWKSLGLMLGRVQRPPDVRTSSDSWVADWVNGIGTDDRTWLAVQGSNTQARDALYRAVDDGPWTVAWQRAREWLRVGPMEDLIRQLSSLKASKDYGGLVRPAKTWEWLWCLVDAESLYVEEPLRSRVEQPIFLVHDAMRVLFEARFKAMEGATDIDAYMVALTEWLTGRPLTDEQAAALTDGSWKPRDIYLSGQIIDLLLFFLALAEQNGVITKYVVAWDDVSAADRKTLTELRQVLEAVSRLARHHEIPLAFLVGVDPSRLSSVRRLNPRLYEAIGQHLAPV